MSPISNLLKADREIVLETTWGVWLLRRDAVNANMYHVIDVQPNFFANLSHFVGQALEMGTNPQTWRGNHLRALQRELNNWSKP